MMSQNKKSNFGKKTAFSFIELAIVVAIIGALFGIIIGGQSVVRASKISNARSLTKSSPAAEIEGLVLWFESASIDSFDQKNPANNTIIATWKDINPKAITINDVTQSTVGAQPTYIKEGINGVPAVRFDGNDFLRNANPKLPTENNERTLFIVAGNGVDNSTWDFVFHYGSAANLQSFDVPLFDGLADTTKGVGIHLYSNDYLISTESGTKSKIISVTYKYTTAGTLASNMQIYINSFYKAADSGRNVNSNLILNTTSTDLVLGAGVLGGVERARVDIGEIIMFNRMLTTEERKSIESYLSKKWGIDLI